MQITAPFPLQMARIGIAGAMTEADERGLRTEEIVLYVGIHVRPRVLAHDDVAVCAEIDYLVHVVGHAKDVVGEVYVWQAVLKLAGTYESTLRKFLGQRFDAGAEISQLALLASHHAIADQHALLAFSTIQELIALGYLWNLETK